MITYLNLRIKKFQYDLQKSTYLLVFFFLKGLFYFVSLMFLTFNAPDNVQISASELLYIFFLSIILSHFRIIKTISYEKSFFSQFDSNLIFYIKSVVYPLLFSPFFICLIIASYVYALFEGLIICFLFVLTYGLVSHLPTAKLYALTGLVVLYFFDASFNQVLIIYFTCLMLIFIYTYFRQVPNIKGVKYNKWIDKKINYSVKKEISFYKFYSSEIFYLVGGFVLLFFSFWWALNYFDENTKYAPMMWYYLTFSAAPFALTQFNLLGMDKSILRRIFTCYNLFYGYLSNRLNIYMIILSVLNFTMSILFSSIYNYEFEIIYKYAYGYILFYQLVYISSFIMSTYFFEIKETQFRYGQYFSSKNVNISTFFLIFASLFVSLTYHTIGDIGLLFCAVLFYLFRHLYLKKVIKKIVKKRMMKIA